MGEKVTWQAPKPTQDSIEGLMRVTARIYETLYDELNLDDDQLRGKTILSLGNGLSNFANHINALSEGTKCYAIDPIYAYLGEDIDEFQRNLSAMRLEPAITNEEYKNFKAGLKNGIYIAGDGEVLPLLPDSVDLAILPHLIGNIGNPETVRKIIDEVLRVLKPTGEFRIPEVNFVKNPDNTLSLNFLGKPINSSQDYLEILGSLQKQGYHIYTVLNPNPRRFQPGLIADYMKESGNTVTSFRGVIVRSDNAYPTVVAHISKDVQDVSERKDLAAGLDLLQFGDSKRIQASYFTDHVYIAPSRIEEAQQRIMSS